MGGRSRIERAIAEAKALLAGLPKQFVVERLSLESRIASLEDELGAADVTPSYERAYSEWIFSGGPVVGARGVELRFLARALDSIGRAFQHQTGKHTSLHPRVHVTRTVHGSFGFAVEELGTQPVPGTGKSPLALATEDLRAFVEAAGAPRVESVRAAAADLAKDAFAAMRTFFEVLDGSSAELRVLGGDEVVALDRRAVQKARARTLGLHIDRDVTHELGIFDGVLPYSRRFEFRVLPKRTPRQGTVAPAADIEALQRFRKKRCYAEFRVTTAGRRAGRSRRSYELLALLTEEEYTRRKKRKARR